MQQQHDSDSQRYEQVKRRVREQGDIATIRKKKSKLDEESILACLKNHFIFYNLSPKELDSVKNYMTYAEVPEETQIFKQGAIGLNFYIIEKGLVEIRVNDQTVKILKNNQGFGEIALLYEVPRPSSAIVKEKCNMWVIDRVSFREAVEEIVINEFEANQKFLEGMAFYQFLKPHEKQKVAASFITLKYYKNQNLIEEGDPGSSFYIIKEGTASLLQSNVEQRKIYKGEYFGHNSLYYNTIRKMTVKAQDEVVCQVLGRQTLAKIIGEQYRDVMFRNYVKFVIQKNRKLFNLLKKDEEMFFRGIKRKYYKANSVVFYKGTTINRLIVIMEGRIKKFRSAKCLAQSGELWGELYLKSSENVKLEDDIIVETESVLIQLDLFNIKLLLEKMSGIMKSTEQISKPVLQKINIDNLTYQGDIQKGNESNLILLKYDNRSLIGKQYSKKHIDKNNLETVVKQEMDVCSMFRHPFVPKIYDVIDCDNVVIKVCEFIKGEALYDTIREIGLLSTLDCQFYASTILLIIEKLMSQQIVVRDLKPDNFVIDQKGYPNLVSFGSAKCISDNHRTSTTIGTPHYMAPEVILGKQYNELVDLWSLGVMMYEFMVGELPFGANTENPYEIYESVIKGDADFPRNFKDRRAKKVIENLLSLNPQVRHGGSIQTLKDDSWFEQVQWQSLLDRTETAPYKPSNLKLIKPSLSVPFTQYIKDIK